MKTIFSLLLVSMLLSACANKEASPVISVLGLQVNDDELNYAKQIDSIPALALGDELNVVLRLYGNGSDLKVFQVNEAAEAQLDKLDFNPQEVSSESGFTDVEKGRLRFVDGVDVTTLQVKVKIVSTTKQEARLCFYLSSKAETQGAQCIIALKTQSE